ncbi:MAG: SRPBCC family protein [Armatimonadota bacterium]
MAVHEKSVIVNAPVHNVFMMWRNWEDFPRFMSHVKEVKKLGGGKSHWKASIAGVEEEWDAETTGMQDDRLIGWKSINGLQNSGEVRFDDMGGSTKITVHIEYDPPAGPFGEAAEVVYVGREFDRDLEKDLQKFKSKVETKAA